MIQVHEKKINTEMFMMINAQMIRDSSLYAIFRVKMSSERSQKHLYLSTLVAITFPKRNRAMWEE